MEIIWTETHLSLADGTVVNLRAPEYSFSDHAYGAPAADVLLSPRVAPQMIGLGLLARASTQWDNHLVPLVCPQLICSLPKYSRRRQVSQMRSVTISAKRVPVSGLWVRL